MTSRFSLINLWRILRLLLARFVWRDSVLASDLAIATWCRELRRDGLAPVHGRIAVLAVHNQAWIEWAIYAACWMRKLGFAPVLLYSSSEMSRLYGPGGPGSWSARKLEAGNVPATLGRIPDVELCDIDIHPDTTAAQHQAYRDWAQDYAHTVAAYALRVEEFEGHPKREAYVRQVEEETSRLTRTAATADAIFRRLTIEYGVNRLIAFSGLIGVSPAFGEAARRSGWDAVFCETWANPGHMLCSLNQPALDFDVEALLGCLGDWNESRVREIEQFLRFQETGQSGEVKWLKDSRPRQRSSADEDLPPPLRNFLAGGKRVFLLAPNCIGDSATLRARTIFRSQQEWIGHVCEWFRARPDLRLIIRAHPGESYLESVGALVVRLGAVARCVAEGAPNIWVIQGSDDISTYGLIAHAQVGLVWMSTAGVDMVVRGRPVVAAARPKYSGLGIVLEPADREEYFRQLDRLAVSAPEPSVMQKETGLKYLTVVERELSYEAFSSTRRARGIHLAGHPQHGECSTFYRILAGYLPIASRPPNQSTYECLDADLSSDPRASNV